ncbi:MAG: RNA methyltransferase substrate-binding domain-containing protein, partial [Thermoanaerobaculia bacterium]|nr:RNA methyltransferase substrate-binding domain-containing protein [Thermoanaerobaculia bacterium]
MSRIAGFHPVREALRGRPEAIRRVWVARSRTGARRREIEALCHRGDVPLEEVSEVALDALGIEVHNGFAAEIDPGSPDTGAGADPGLVVLLEDVQDPRNLGAILRVCEGAGVGRVLIRDRGSA